MSPFERKVLYMLNKKQRSDLCSEITTMDRQTRSAIRQCSTLDGALRKNPHGRGSTQYHMWFNLLRAKWAIIHKEIVLLSKQS